MNDNRISVAALLPVIEALQRVADHESAGVDKDEWSNLAKACANVIDLTEDHRDRDARRFVEKLRRT